MHDVRRLGEEQMKGGTERGEVGKWKDCDEDGKEEEYEEEER